MTVCQKLGVILESKVVQKLSLEKKVLINNGLLDFFEWIRLIFGIQNWLWKYDIGTFWQTVIHWWIEKKYLWVCWFLAKNLAFYEPPYLKFNNRTDISMYITLASIFTSLSMHSPSFWQGLLLEHFDCLFVSLLSLDDGQHKENFGRKMANKNAVTFMFAVRSFK